MIAGSGVGSGAGGYRDAIAAGRLLSRRIAPWLVVVEILRAGRDHWKDLDPIDRRELTRLLRKSKGLPQNLTERERRELLDIARRLELLRFARNAAAAAAVGRARGRR